MKKTRIIWCVIIIFICTIIAIIVANKNGLKFTTKYVEINYKDDNTIIDKVKFEVYSYMENKNNVYHVSYPYYYYHIEERNGEKCNTLEDLDGSIRDTIFGKDEVMSNEDKLYIIRYIKNLEEKQKNDVDEEGGIEAYKIHLTYYDENGNENSGWVQGYNEFPDNWSEFINVINRVCKLPKNKQLATVGKIQTVTSEYLKEVFNMKDSDVEEGSLDDLIKTNKLSMEDVTGLFYPDDEIKEYYAKRNEDKVSEFIVREIANSKTTDEEFENFVNSYLLSLGKKVKYKDKKNGYTAFTTDDGSYSIGQTQNIKNMKGVYSLYFDGGRYYVNYEWEKDGFALLDLYYSKNKKFFIIRSGYIDEDLVKFVTNENG